MANGTSNHTSGPDLDPHFSFTIKNKREEANGDQAVVWRFETLPEGLL